MKKKFWMIGVIALALVATTVVVLAQDAGKAGEEQTQTEEKAEEIFAAEGLLVGRIDSRSVEIEVDGTPQAFGLSEELREQELPNGVEVRFQYRLNEHGQGIITRLEQKEPTGKDNITHAEGTFVGFADSHTVEIRVGDEPTAFAIGKELAGLDLQQGDGVRFAYQEASNGRLEITALEKTGEKPDRDSGDQKEKNGPEKNLKSARGMLTGRIDSHSVEIEINGKPQAFALGDELRDKEFARGEISFQYYVDSNGRSVMTRADFQEPRQSEVHTAEGVFSGMADNHTVEVKIQGQPRAFGLDENITFTGIEAGQEIFIAYQEDETGRPLIIKVEKIF